LQEFQQYRTPDDGRKFTELYNVQRLTSRNIDSVSKVCITTIQRLYAMLRGEDFLEENEEGSSFELPQKDTEPVDVVYNSEIPLEMFDVIITDECHRSIYHLWRQVLEYFDAFIIGLTATPSKQTLGFFNQNLVMEYGHDRAVADGVNVGYDVYRINTKITGGGGKVEAGFYVDKRDKLSRKVRWEQLADDLEYEAGTLDRSVVAKDQIRTVIRTFRDKLFTEIFPGAKRFLKRLFLLRMTAMLRTVLRLFVKNLAKGTISARK
jgi:type I restriction enzyme R subunit